MGPGLIRAGTRVYCDSSVFIYAIERHVQFGAAASAVLKRGAANEIQIITCELTILETLVRPLRDNDPSRVKEFELAFGVPWLHLVEVRRDLLRAAAVLRAGAPSLRTPDAIHLAAANDATVDHFVTNDRSLANTCGSRACLLSSHP